MTKQRVVAVCLAIVVSLILLATFGRSLWVPFYYELRGRRTVDDVLRSYGPQARATWAERLKATGVAYPPSSLTFIVIKSERRLEVWIPKDGAHVRIAEYPILAASGTSGPKLREGDNQVPEGIYVIEGLNPNSSYHLSMKVNYPNAFDRERGKEDRRNNLGGDIFIHGKRASIGCLAMGDPTIEELFVLVADVGHAHTDVIIAPCDFRTDCRDYPSSPAWTAGLYADIRSELTAKFRPAN